MSYSNSGGICALCVYGPQHVESISNILIPALKAQILPAGRSLTLHLLNYLGSQSLLADAGALDLSVQDWSSSRENSHIGFGEGINYLVASAAPTGCFFLINPDSFPMTNCLNNLLTCYSSGGEIGIVEARQWPNEHPKEYNCKNLETPWASGAFSLISAEAFCAVGGFDTVYFLYNEDVDLSWRMWLSGYRVLYSPNSPVAHFTGLFSYREDRFYYEHFFSSRNFIVLSYKFFGDQGEVQALDYLEATTFPTTFKERVIVSYKKVKPLISRYSKDVDSPHIKILGFNQYHELCHA